MNEAVRNLAMLVWAVCAMSTDSTAYANAVFIGEEASSGSETTVYGAAKTPSGKTEEVVVEQPSANDNPLGNPIVSPENTTPPVVELPTVQPSQSALETRPRIEETLPQNPSVSSEPPQAAAKQIQDTLYESGGRIYDVQSYPASDIKAIEEPNVDTTISTVPSY